MVITIKNEQSFFTSPSSYVGNVFKVYLDDILFSACDEYDDAYTFAHGLRSGVTFLGKSCLLLDLTK